MDMRLSAALILALSPLLASAGPQPLHQTTPIKVALSKRSGPDGFTDTHALGEHVDNLTSKYARAFEAYEHHTGAKHPLAGPNLRRHASGTVSLTNRNNILWYGEVSVGTPPQMFNVLFDTGTGDIWLPSSGCVSVACKGHAKYNTGKSSIASYANRTFALESGVGAGVEGSVYLDTVTLGGVTVCNQEIGAAAAYPHRLKKGKFILDGVLDLVFSGNASYTHSPVFQTIAQKSQATSPVFAFKLSGDSPELDIGAIDTNSYTGDIVYSDVTENVRAILVQRIRRIWHHDRDSGKLTRKTLQQTERVIFGSPGELAAFYEAVGGSPYSSGLYHDQYSVPCNKVPTVAFTCDGQDFKASADTFIYRTYPVAGGNICIGDIMTMNTEKLNSVYWMLGDTFLRNVYAVFDGGSTPRVGFARLA